MRKLFLLIIVMIFALPIQGQNDYREDDAIAACQAIDLPLNVDAICEWYVTCPYNWIRPPDCFDQLVVLLIRQCTVQELNICGERALLYAIGMNNSSHSGTLTETIAAFDIGNYSRAAHLLETFIDDPNYFPFYERHLALGVIHYVIGNYDMASDYLTEAMSANFYNPWAFYYRGKSYELMGDTERAMRDYYTYDALATPLIKAMLPLSNFRYRLPNMEQWTAYPILSRSYGPCCTIFQDLTLQPGFPVQIARLDNDDTIAVANLFSDTYNRVIPILFLEQGEDNFAKYSLTISTDFSGTSSGTIQLDIIVFPSYIVYFHTEWWFEGSFTVGGVLLPLGEIDPHINTYQSRPCPGLPISHIQLRDTFFVGDSFGFRDLRTSPRLDSNTIFDMPLHAWEGTRDKEFIVREGPVCADEGIWWYVTSDGVEGWMRENLGTTYNMLPNDLWDEWVWYWYNPKPDGVITTFPTPLGLLNIIGLNGE